jgi:hypothetical protein
MAGKFTFMLNQYKSLQNSVRTFQNRAEYHKIKAFFSGLGITASLILGLVLELITNDLSISIATTVISSGITLPLLSLIGERVWDKREEALRQRPGPIFAIKLEKERYNDEIFEIERLRLSPKEAASRKVIALDKHFARLESIENQVTRKEAGSTATLPGSNYGVVEPISKAVDDAVEIIRKTEEQIRGKPIASPPPYKNRPRRSQ